jgi:hypothetical protein
MWSEAEIVSDRIDRVEANRAVLVQLAVATMLSKKAQSQFAKRIKSMTD